jgi:sialic acid synthase SpsE
MKRPRLIAELGKIHCGNVQTAKKLIGLAARAGVNAVKLQAYEVKDLMPDHKNYKRNKLSHLQIGELYDLKKVAAKHDIEFWCSCFSKSLIKPLSEFTDTVKLASTYLEKDDYIQSCLDNFEEVHVSTGFHDRATVAALVEKYKSVLFYHCTSEYPVHERFNLARIRELGLRGYSHHARAVEPMLYAWMMGAQNIEFHFYMDNSSWRLDEHAVRYLIKQINSLYPMVRDRGSSREMGKNYEFFKKEFKDLLFT